jgi:exonuclease SbcD
LNGTLEQLEAVSGTTGDAYLKIELDEVARAGLADEVRELFPEAVDVVLASPIDTRSPVRTEARLGRPAAELFREYLAGRKVDDDRLGELFDTLLEETYET